MIKIVECPRDAMQGLNEFIPSETKVRYINQLLKVGFDTLDFGSFVSPEAIPQLRDTEQVLAQLEVPSGSKLLAIIANIRGAETAAGFEAIDYLGFPLSLSETFQRRNTNRSIPQALEDLQEIQSICKKSDKRLVTYLSMGFGNPYGDPYEPTFVTDFVEKLIAIDVEVISLADTIGVSDEQNIKNIFKTLRSTYPDVEFGVHLHARKEEAKLKIKAAYDAGCRRFDGAINGYGGCPMASDSMVGNIPTETIIEFLNAVKHPLTLNKSAFAEAMNQAPSVFLQG